MNRAKWIASLTMWIACSFVPATVRAQQTVAQSLSVLEEKLDRLRAQVEDLQFRQQKMQTQIDEMQTRLTDLRKAGPGVTADDLQALQNRIQAVDAARVKDKQVILDQLAKELSALGGGRPAPPGKSHGPAPAEGKEHVVQKGETLAAIAKQHGVAVADLVKANNLANPNDLKVGQKLVIPK